MVTFPYSYVTPGGSCTREEGKMADKFTEFAGRMGKAPKGVGTGLKLLAAAAAVAYGVKESIYTGNLFYVFGAQVSMKSSYCFCMMQDRCDI